MCFLAATHKSKRTLCWGQTPKFCLMVLSSERISLPRMKAVPEVGGNKPVKMDLNDKCSKCELQNVTAQSKSRGGLFHMH